MPRSSKSRQSTTTKTPRKPPSPPRPSASILLVSPANEILLLHRVQTSSSFPSAHVFPGGNCSATHDGEIPGVDDEARHRDGEVYRWAAIRECFEESGLLLARKKGQDGLVSVPEEQREKARKDVHAGTRRFKDVLVEWDAEADLDNLIPFTRWITPTNVPKRFTTQMYLYLMPLLSSSPSLPSSDEAVLPLPTSDGGIEHTAARFLPAQDWLSQARADEIILFPPQFFLLHLVSKFLIPSSYSGASSLDRETLQKQRSALLSFIDTHKWGNKCISPSFLTKTSDGRAVLGLDKSGPEIEAMKKGGREGTSEWVVFVDFRKEGPRRVEVGKRDEVLKELGHVYIWEGSRYRASPHFQSTIEDFDNPPRLQVCDIVIINMPRNKPRLHLALYARPKHPDAPHYALLICPKDINLRPSQEQQILKHHVLNRLPISGLASLPWAYEYTRIASLQSDPRLLICVVIGKLVVSAEEVAAIVQEVKIYQGDDEDREKAERFDCVEWVQSAVGALRAKGAVSGMPEWEVVKEKALAFLKREREAGRWDAGGEKVETEGERAVPVLELIGGKERVLEAR